jgi:hypothetical protein
VRGHLLLQVPCHGGSAPAADTNYYVELIAAGLQVYAGICPFNFPAMVPLAYGQTSLCRCVAAPDPAGVLEVAAEAAST